MSLFSAPPYSKIIRWSNFKGLKINNSKSHFLFCCWWPVSIINKIILVQTRCGIFHPQSSKDHIKRVLRITSILYMRILRYAKMQWRAHCHTTKRTSSLGCSSSALHERPQITWWSSARSAGQDESQGHTSPHPDIRELLDNWEFVLHHITHSY